MSFGTSWRNVRAAGKDFYLSHLSPFTLRIDLDGDPVSVSVAFGHHVFTDEKAVGPPFKYGGETRYLSPERVDRSRGLPDLLKSHFAEEHSRACRNQHGGKQFFMLQESDWAIFYDLRLHSVVQREFRLRVITAYTLDELSRLSVPGYMNELYANSVILKRLLNGQDVNHDRRRR